MSLHDEHVDLATDLCPTFDFHMRDITDDSLNNIWRPTLYNYIRYRG